MEDTDRVAVLEAGAGNTDAFRALVERHSRSVFRLAWRVTGNEQDAEDIVQETFLRAYRQLGSFESRSNFATWLYRIAVNCSLDVMRGRARWRTVQDGREETNGDLLTSLPARDPWPDRLALSGELRSKVMEALGDLSPIERTAFVLRHCEEVSMEEIGRALGVNINAAKHSVFRAVKKMRRALEPVRK